MRSDTGTHQFSERTLRQVAADARRALVRHHFAADQAAIDRCGCVDHQPEQETAFGRQLWYFEAVVSDAGGHRTPLHGAIEYSIQYGLHELVDDGVFEVAEQRERFRKVYHSEPMRPSWRQPAHRWLATALIATSAAWLAYLLMHALTL